MQQKLYSYSVHLYIFNVTNPEEFLSGDDEVLKLKEVGPFTYRYVSFIKTLYVNVSK